MMPVIWIIGGTSEGRQLIRALESLPVQIYVSVATEYGAELIAEQPNVTVMAERKNLEAMQSFIQEHKPVCVVDATHPYATIVTATVQEACQKEQTEYLRLVRPQSEAEGAIMVHDFAEAVELLNQVEGNIFLTTGSKNLPDFVKVNDYQERIALRVLPMESSLQMAVQLGYKPANIVCMQGPFSQELNIAMLRRFNSRYMVTKDSGSVGGFEEKVAAAKAANAKLIVIGRAQKEEGAGYSDILSYLQKKFADKQN